MPLLLWLGKLISHLVSALPINVQMGIGDAIGVLWFDILRIRRGEALQNLKNCFPEWDERKRCKVARKSVQNLGRSFVEFTRFPTVSSQYKDDFELVGREHLEAALKKNKGVFLLTQHIGNGDWATVGLSLHGIKLHVVSKKMSWSWFNDIWFQARKDIGTEFIPDRNSSYAILKALKKNACVAFMLDQFMGPPIGVRTKFFGMETGTAMGLAVLAGRSGAAVVPVVTHRAESGQTVIEFSEEIPFEKKQDQTATVAHMTQVYCDKVEEFVRRFPEQWMWVHRRWKPFREY